MIWEQWVVRKDEKVIAGQRPGGECIKSSRREVGKTCLELQNQELSPFGIFPEADSETRIQLQIVSLRGDPRKPWLGRGGVRQGKKGRH